MTYLSFHPSLIDINPKPFSPAKNGPNFWGSGWEYKSPQSGFSGPWPLNRDFEKTEITTQIFGRSHFEFLLWLLPEGAFETLTAPHPCRYFTWMHAYRHNSSADFCGRNFPGNGNNNRDDRAPPVSCELSRKRA
jgi:hypothetical protein